MYNTGNSNKPHDKDRKDSAYHSVGSSGEELNHDGIPQTNSNIPDCIKYLNDICKNITSYYTRKHKSTDEKLPISKESKTPTSPTYISDDNFLKTEPSDIYGPVYYYYKKIIDGNNIGTEVTIIGDDGTVLGQKIFLYY